MQSRNLPGVTIIARLQMLTLAGRLDDSQVQGTASWRFRIALGPAQVAHTEEEDVYATAY